MGYQINRSESIPPVRLLSEVKPSVENQPVELGNFRQIRIEQFLSLKNLSDNSKRNYYRQLTTFIDWCDGRRPVGDHRDWQAIRMNDVRRYKEYLEGDRELKPTTVGTAIAAAGGGVVAALRAIAPMSD